LLLPLNISDIDNFSITELIDLFILGDLYNSIELPALCLYNMNARISIEDKAKLIFKIQDYNFEHLLLLMLFWAEADKACLDSLKKGFFECTPEFFHQLQELALKNSLTKVQNALDVYPSELTNRYLGRVKALAVESKKTGSYVHIDLFFLSSTPRL
jgi:hypothetical protein